MNEEELEQNQPRVNFVENPIENFPHRKLKKSNTNAILKRKTGKNVTSILKKEQTLDNIDFIYVKKTEVPFKKTLRVDISSVKQKLDKFLEKVRRKKVLAEIKMKLEEDLNSESTLLYDETDKEREKEELKAFSEIHKLLKLRNAKNEPYFLELEELFTLKSIIFEALFHEDDRPFLGFRNLLKAVKRITTYLSLLIVTNRIYIIFTMSIILANSIEIGLQHKDRTSKIPHVLYFYGFYIAEIFLKISAYGFFVNETSYLRDKWNLLDFLAFLLTMVFDQILATNVNFMPMRLFRLVDYLEIEKVQLLLESLFYSLRFLLETLGLFCFFIFVAGVVSLHLFSGIFSKHCLYVSTGFDSGLFCGNYNCPSGSSCFESLLSSDDIAHFNDIFHSIFLCLRIVTLDNWTQLLNDTQMAFSNYSWFFFFFTVSVGNFFFINLIIAALKINFVIASEKLGRKPAKRGKKRKNPMIIKRKYGKFQISLKRYNLKMMKMYHLHKHINLASKILSHHNIWTVDTKASSIFNSIKSFFSRMVRASFFVRDAQKKNEISGKIRSNSEISQRHRKAPRTKEKKMRTFVGNEKERAKGGSILAQKKKSGWMENFVLKSAFVESKQKKEQIEKMNKELKNKYLRIRIKTDLEFKSASSNDVLPSKSLQEQLANQDSLLRKTKKLRVFYDLSLLLSEINKEDAYTRSGKLSQNFASSMRLPLSSRSSFQIKCFKILAERQKHHLKSFLTYSTIIAKNITQRYLPNLNPNQNYVEKRNKRKVKPLKKEAFKEDLLEKSSSIDSNVSHNTPKKNKSVYFGSPNSKAFAHQNSALSQTSKAATLRKSLFARKKEVRVNVFTDCYGNEHGFEEIRAMINRDVQNKVKEEPLLNFEEYLKIRNSDLEKKLITQDVWSGFDIAPKFNPFVLIGIFDSLNEKFDKNLNFTLQRLRKKSLFLINSPLFQGFFLAIVLPNVIFLSLREILDQPIIDYTNFGISVLFFVEIIIKAFALGLKRLFVSKRNLLECCVLLSNFFIIIYVSSRPKSSPTALFPNPREFPLLTILQSFTILRAVRLFALIDYMHFIMNVISNTIANFSLIALSLVVFIVIYTLLGMQIFELSRNSPLIGTRVSNFSSFSLAFMEVFDLLTLDNWYSFAQVSLKNSSDIVVALRIFYVVSLIFICNFIMLNLFIDLLCQHFENQNIVTEAFEEKELTYKSMKSLQSRSTTRLSTTKTKLKILEEELDFDDDLSSLSSFDEENFNKLIKKMFIPNQNLKEKNSNSSENEPAETSPHKPLLFAILQDSVTRRISEDHLPRSEETSPLKRSIMSPLKNEENSAKEPSPNRRKDTFNFQIEGSQNNKEKEENSSKNSLEAVNKPIKPKEKQSVDSVFSVFSSGKPFLNILEKIDLSQMTKKDSETGLDNTTKHREAKQSHDIGKFLKTVLANFEDEEEFTYLKDVKCQFSLYLFSKENKFRKLCFKILVNRLFHYLMNFVILLSMVKLIIDTFADDYYSLVIWTNTLNYIINLSFLSEVLVKIVAFGLFMDQMSYFRDSVNVLEFVNSLGFILALVFPDVEILKSLLLLRMLRPLNFISNNKSLKLVYEALLRSFAQIINIIMLVFLVWLIFGVIGISLFSGNFGYCSYPQNYGVSEAQCSNWANNRYNFDNIYNALCTLFVLSTFDGWSDLLNIAVNSAPPTIGPFPFYSKYRSYVFFLLFIIIGVWFFMNFIIGVIFSNFLEAQKSNRHKYLNNDQQLWLEIQKKILKEKPLNYILPQSQVSQYFYRCIKAKWFRNFMYVLLFFNAIYLSIYYYNSTYQYNLFLSLIGYIFTFFYCLEVLLHFLVYGVRGYLTFKGGILNVCIALYYFLQTVVSLSFQSFIENERQKTNFIQVFSLFHALILLRLFKKFKSLKRLIRSLLFSSKHIFSTFILLVLIFFVYAIIGCSLFGKIVSGQALNDYINFRNFFTAMMTLFTCSTQDNWTQIMDDCSNVCINQEIQNNCGSSWARIYFFSFMFLVGHVLLNMIILILMQAFEEFYMNPDQPLRFYSDYVKKFKVFWSKHCFAEFKLYLDEKNIVSFLKSLGSPLGLETKDPFKKCAKKLMRLKIFINEKGFSFFNEMLYVTLKELYSEKIYYPGIEKKAKNYIIHQENLFYKSLTKHKEFNIRNFRLNFGQKTEESDKSVRFFRRVISIYIVMLFWKKYTDIFMEASMKNNDSQISKLKLIEEIFNEIEDENKFNRLPPKISKNFGQRCERGTSIFQPNLFEKEKRKLSLLQKLPKYIGNSSPKEGKVLINFFETAKSQEVSKTEL